MKTIVRYGVRDGRGVVIRSVVLVLAVFLAACSTAAGEEDTPFEVVATTSILGELTQRIAGDEVTVEVLMPIGADPHEFEASAKQAQALRGADLVVANGLGLEARLDTVLRSAEADGATVLEVGPHVDPLPFGSQGEDHADHGEEGDDPHFWLDPVRMAEAAVIIGDALSDALGDRSGGVPTGGAPAAQGPGTEGPRARAAALADDLRALADELATRLQSIPPERRVLVTNHDALGYFADRFGFEVIGTIIPSGTALAEPSARDLSELVALMDATGVPAIFAETSLPRQLSDTLAAELGPDVEVVELYTGSLGEPGSEAATYEGMMRTNVERIVEALT